MPAIARRRRIVERSRLHEMHRPLRQPDLISLANSASTAGLYPIGRIASALDAALTHHSHAALNDALTGGFESLRDPFAQKVRDARIACGPIPNICALERTSSHEFCWGAIIASRFLGTLALCQIRSVGQQSYQARMRWPDTS